MKLDEKYTSVKICPTTGKQLSNDQRAYSDGVCPNCGHYNGGTYTHSTTVPGRWRRPNFVEWLTGKRKKFVTKEEEDQIMNALKGDLPNQQESDGPTFVPGAVAVPSTATTKAYTDSEVRRRKLKKTL